MTGDIDKEVLQKVGNHTSRVMQTFKLHFLMLILSWFRESSETSMHIFFTPQLCFKKKQHLSVLSIILTELLQSVYDTCTQWTPANVYLLYCSTEPFILLCGGVHQSAGHKRQCAKARQRLPAIYL